MEGCDTGFWKKDKRLDLWVGFSPNTSFDAVFAVQSSFGGSLLDVIDQKGGGEKALAREAVASLLNATSPQVNATFTVNQVIEMVQIAYDFDDFKEFERILKDSNKQFCPLK